MARRRRFLTAREQHEMLSPWRGNRLTMPRRVLTAREQVALTAPWRTSASLILNGHFAPQPAEHWDERALRLARRLLAAGVELRWERDSSGDWILVGRNPDGNPVAVRTERAPSVRTSRRTVVAADGNHHEPGKHEDEGRPS